MVARFLHRDLWLLNAILLVALFLRTWGIGFGLPFTYHPDEHQYVEAAVGFLSGDLNPHQFNNPALFKYLLGAGYAVWYVLGVLTGGWRSVADFQATASADPTAVYLLGRLVSALFGVATVGLTWALGRRAGSRLTGWLSAAALAVAFLHVRDSHYAVNDVPATFFTTAALLFSLRVLQQGAGRDYLLAGTCVGLAGATKYTGWLAAASLIAAHFDFRFSILDFRFALSQSKIQNLKSKIVDRHLWAAGGMAVVAYLAAAPYTVLDWQTFVVDVGQLSSRGVVGFKGLQLDQAAGWLFYLKVLNWGLGLPLLLVSLAGLALALWRRRPADLVLLTFPLFLYTYLGGQLLIFARFIIPAVPTLVVLAAEVVEATAARLLSSSESRRLATVAAGAAVLLVIPTANSLRHDLLLTRDDTRTLAKAWIEANIPAGTRLIVQSNGPELSGGDYLAPRSRRSYDLTVVGTTSLEKKALDTYRQQGFAYVVVSSFSYDRVLLDPEREAERRAFYTSLAANAGLAQEFRPYTGDVKPPFVFDQIYGPATDLGRFVRPGPVIQVYQLR
jgi:4-amino-4-deoxy-L-arabinose transferase-like glycosyltransferase